MSDRRLIFASAFVRALSVGMLGVLLGLHLAARDLDAASIGLVVAAGLAGGATASLLVTLGGDRLGRRRTLLVLALASIAGRFLTGTTAGSLIQDMGYFNFYLLTTIIAMPGVILFWYMIRSGLADVSIGSAGKEGDN